MKFFSTENKEQEETESEEQAESAEAETSEGEAEAEAEAEGEAEAEAAAEAPAEKTPEERIAELEAEVADKHQQMVMAFANEQNAIRIAKEDVAKARVYAVSSFAKSLLDVADNLTRAREAVPVEEIEKEGNDLLKNLVEGVQLTEDGLHKTFAQNGIQKYGDVGDVFDANLHEALYMYEDPTGTPNTLGQLVQTGYMLKERVLRPAKAGIVKGE